MNIFKIPQKGFTLIEIMAVLAIIAILGGILISSGYRENQVRNSLMVDSEELSLFFREMQNRSTGFLINELNPSEGYGVFLDILNPLKVNSFYKTTTDPFSVDDVPINNSLKASDDLVFNMGNYIKRICLNDCSATTTKLGVYFLKPRPQAYFYMSQDGLVYTDMVNTIPITNACIEIAPPGNSNELRRIEVYAIGQITFAYGECD